MTRSKEWKENLIRGYHAFRAGDYPIQKDLYETLGKHGQSPKVMLIGCCDSRADPSDIFNAHPGEMFTLRNVGNVVPHKDMIVGHDGTSAALEFAVTVLEVEAVVVMGHESCGGINACLSGMGDAAQSDVGKWISILNGARDRVLASGKFKEALSPECQLEMEFEGIRESLKNLMSFDYVQTRVASGKLDLLGAYFSIIKGVLMFADKDGNFQDVPTK